MAARTTIRSAKAGAVDTTMMLAMHDAFRRDLARLARAAQGSRDPDRLAAVHSGWRVFHRQLHLHHTAEDEDLWPVMRAHLADRPDELAMLDAMEAEHATVDPLADAVDLALEGPVTGPTGPTGPADQQDRAEQPGQPEQPRQPGQPDLVDLVDALHQALTSHLRHEEQEALPLIGRVVTGPEWGRFSAVQRRRNGVRGAAELFPWLLDDAPSDRAGRTLNAFPAPVRFACRVLWQPRYTRKGHWGADSPARPTAA